MFYEGLIVANIGIGRSVKLIQDPISISGRINSVAIPNVLANDRERVWRLPGF